MELTDITGFISTEMKFPTETSTKKKRYVTFTCKTCGKVTTKGYTKNLFRDQCVSCVQSLTQEEFISRSILLHGHKYDYSKTVFKSTDSQIQYICPTHGEVSQRAQEHLDGHGCFQCGGELRAEQNRLSESEWYERLSKFPKISLAYPQKLEGYHTYIDFTCTEHGNFSTQLGALNKNVVVCKKCANALHQMQSVREHLVGTVVQLYLVFFPEIGKYKLGCTTSVNTRFSKDKDKKLEVIWIKEYEYTKGIHIEHTIHTNLSHMRNTSGKKFISEGSTEFYDVDITPYVQGFL